MKKVLSLLILATLMLSACGAEDSSSKKADEKENTTTTTTAATTTAATTTTAPVEVKDPRNAKVMLFGDSITDGFWLNGGYRTFLCNKLEENGYSQYVDFVGRKNSGDCYDGDHEGYTAYSIDALPGRSGITKLANSLLKKAEPDVICLQIGTNDILSHYELDTVDARLEVLVDKCLEYVPEDGMLYLATLPCMDANDTTYIDGATFTVEYMDQCIADFNDKVKALVEKKKGEGANIELADVNSVLTKEDLYDGVHPNEDGYKKLADFWYDIIVEHITNY